MFEQEAGTFLLKPEDKGITYKSVFVWNVSWCRRWSNKQHQRKKSLLKWVARHRCHWQNLWFLSMCFFSGHWAVSQWRVPLRLVLIWEIGIPRRVTASIHLSSFIFMYIIHLIFQIEFQIFMYLYVHNCPPIYLGCWEQRCQRRTIMALSKAIFSFLTFPTHFKYYMLLNDMFNMV